MNHQTVPAHGWTCFHCGETFKDEAMARDHFGARAEQKPGCVIKVERGGERGLLHALREAEDLVARHMEEDSDIHRLMRQLQHKHKEALCSAEEVGYRRGLRAAKIIPQQTEEPQHA